MALARGHWALSQDLEDKTKYGNYIEADIEDWRKARLINDEDIERLGLSPGLKTLKSACEDWKRSWRVTSGEDVARKCRTKNILEALGGDIPVRFLRHSHGLKMIEYLREKKGLKITTIQRHIHDLKRIMRIQIANGVIQWSPFTELSAGTIPVHERVRPRILNGNEVETVLTAARSDEDSIHGCLYLLLLLCFGCGLRRREALSLRWEMVDWDARVLRLPDSITKTRRTRNVGLGQRLYYELLLRKRGEGPVFPELDPTTVSHAVSDLFRSCGIDARLHDARHTYATMIQEAGAQPHEAMQRTGHTDSAMLGHYTHASIGEIWEDRFSFMKVAESKEGGA